MTVRNRFKGQKAYGKTPIVYKLARKKNISSFHKAAFKIRGISIKTKNMKFIGWEKV